MSLPLVINPLAEADLIAGRVWCESRRQGMGADFLLCVEELFEQLRREPERFGKEFKDLRVAPVRRFQFAVAYRADDSQVTVVAVYHTRSDPRKWQART